MIFFGAFIKANERICDFFFPSAVSQSASTHRRESFTDDRCLPIVYFPKDIASVPPSDWQDARPGLNIIAIKKEQQHKKNFINQITLLHNEVKGIQLVLF